MRRGSVGGATRGDNGTSIGSPWSRPLEAVLEANFAAADTSTTLRRRDVSLLRIRVDELPNERWNEIVRLRYLERLNSNQIGEQRVLPAGRVRAELKRARDEIRRRYRSEGHRLVDCEDDE